MEEVALWMMGHGYATGHGDTISDMLEELVAQVAKRAEVDGWNRGIADMAQACPVCRESALPTKQQPINDGASGAGVPSQWLPE